MAYDFSTSDFILMIGGQVIFFVLLIMVVYFGMEPISSFPQSDVVRAQIKSFLAMSNASTK
jgi:hypothetical protein